MNPTVKLVLYVVLTLALAILGFGLYSALQALPPPAPRAPTVGSPAPATPTNAAATAATSSTSTTNATSNAATQAPTPGQTNAAGMTSTSTTTAAATGVGDDEDITVRRSSRNLGRATGYGVAMFFVFIALAIVIARDVARYVGTKAENFIFNDNLEGMKDPEYEEAERIWAKGDYLESVRLMRAYLNKHPREQYVALRIAEIYETNLRNYLAAALEYEEVLKKKLPAERWGWAAIHLANLYSGKLDRTNDATKILRRIVDEYGQTAAAKKARERLGLPEPIEPTPAAAEIAAAAATPATDEEEAEPEATTPPPPAHNLPKGFRPK